jgi:hypothetical protein
LIDFAVCVIPDDPDLVLGCTPEDVLAVSQFHVFRSERNASAELAIYARANTFWHGYVLPQVPPPLETIEDVDLRWPSTTANRVRTGEPVRELLREYEKACELDITAGKLRDKLKEKILLYAEDAEALVGPDGKTPWITCKTGTRKSFVMPESTNPNYPLHLLVAEAV